MKQHPELFDLFVERKRKRLLHFDRKHSLMKITPLITSTNHTTTRLFFWDHPGELVPEENFWTLWCNGRLTEADTPTIRLGATPSGLTTAHLHHPPRRICNRRCLSVCLFVSNFAQKLSKGFA